MKHLHVKARDDINHMIDQWLRDGNVITQCPPAYCAPTQASRDVVRTRRRMRQRDIAEAAYDWFTLD